VLLEDEVRNVRAIIAMAQLDEDDALEGAAPVADGRIITLALSDQAGAHRPPLTLRCHRY
jgi:hypothetical protein